MSNQDTSKALALVTQEYRLALEPRGLAEVRDIAKIAAKIGMCGLKTEEEGIMRILFGRELGFSAGQSIRLVHIINGRPTVDAAGIVGRILQHPDCEYFELVESTKEKATWRTKRKGRPELPMSFTIEQAKQANLVGKDNWKAYPEAMLRARAATALARAYWQEVTAGIYTADELQHGVFEVQGDGSVVAVESPAASTMVEVQAEVVDTAMDIADAYLKDIANAYSLDELAEIAANIKAANLNANVKKALVNAYSARKNQLQAQQAQQDPAVGAS